MSNLSSITTTGTAIPAYGSTTIPAQALPTQIGCLDQRLNSTIMGPNIPNFFVVSPATEQTLGYMNSCCQGAPVVIIEDGCAAYCAASDKAGILKVVDCLEPDGNALEGIVGSLWESSEPITTTSSTPAPTATTSTTARVPSNVAVGRSANSVLVSLATGAMLVGWIMNGFA